MIVYCCNPWPALTKGPAFNTPNVFVRQQSALGRRT